MTLSPTVPFASIPAVVRHDCQHHHQSTLAELAVRPATFITRFITMLVSGLRGIRTVHAEAEEELDEEELVRRLEPVSDPSCPAVDSPLLGGPLRQQSRQ